jgi:hypothetical protein
MQLLKILIIKLNIIYAHPINANTNNSRGSKGNSVVKFVRNIAVIVSDFWNHTASNRKNVAPITYEKSN